MSEPSPFSIQVSRLTKFYGSHQALRGVDLSIGTGERVALFGPNGAGKTTLVKILATIVKPTSGSVSVDGADLKDRPEAVRRRIGLVGHGTFLYGHLSAYENLDFYGRIYDVPRRRERIMQVIEQVEMTTRMHDRVGSLSRGMQQRVSIARAMLHDPSVMLLDEPETGLDQRSASIVWSALLGSGSGRRTVIMITHNLERGLELSDRIALLVRGKVVYETATAGMSLERLRELYNKLTGVKE